MPKLPLYDNSGKNMGQVTAADEIFAKEGKEAVVHTALVWYQAALRRGTQSTLTRGEVRGGGRKPWKQKGTGRARAGSNRSPLWKKGGVIFAPKPRSYNYALPKKVRRLALKIVLSDKTKNEKVKIVEQFNFSESKTKQAVKLMKDLGVAGKVLFLSEQNNEILNKSVRNIKGVRILLAQDLNIFDLLDCEWIVADKGSVKRLEEVLA